ncbi:MAG: Mur ligase family protein [Bacteroidota bacterium]|nr:Mur ligase family protein [Bacteroidota bacterium]
MNEYFIGIGGSAMASVAAALAESGEQITGADAHVYPPMSGFLEAKGIVYHDSYSSSHVDLFTAEAEKSRRRFRFVIGNAISRGNPELERVLERKLPYTSLPALIGEECIGERTSLVCTGTHGKTTTTSLAAWVLECAGFAPGFMIGGIPGNFGSGCRLSPSGKVFVTEGDEYDSAFFDKRPKFVHYRPDLLIINNVEFDHADIFGSIDEVVRVFRNVVRIVPGNGLILVNGDDPIALDAARNTHTPVRTFGFTERCDWRAVDIRREDGTLSFGIIPPGEGKGETTRFMLPLPGDFNVRNALGVAAALSALGVQEEVIQKGVASFRGVRRRMELVLEANGITVIDDFAHHPTAIRETLRALRAQYPGKRLRAVFEPRSNTTTRNVFQEELARSFDDADEVLIGPVNRPERYRPEEILDTDRLARDIRERGLAAFAVSRNDELPERVAENLRAGHLVVLLSNGSFGGFATAMIENLRKAASG